MPSNGAYHAGGTSPVWLERGVNVIARRRHSPTCTGHRQRQLRSAADMQLLVDMMQMHLHGAFGYAEFAGDLLVVQAPRYKARDVSFT